MQYFEQLRQWLQAEKEAELQQYQRNVVETPLKERRKRGWCWYPVITNYQEIGLGGQLLVSLERTQMQGGHHVFQVGQMVRLFVNKGQDTSKGVSGTITAVWRDNMKVAFSVDELPDFLEDGRNGIDLLFDDISFREMERALRKVALAKDDRLAELRQVLIGQVAAGTLADAPWLDTSLTDPLNEVQQKAVAQMAAARDVALVHGPPGTGKTTTMVAAVQQVLRHEQQVLVTAQSNAAVDLLAEKLSDKGLSVLRIGNPAKVSDAVQAYSVDAHLSAHPEYKNIKKLQKEARQYLDMAHKYKRKFGFAEREQRRLLFAEGHKRRDDAKELETFILKDVLAKAQVIAATLVGSSHPWLKDKRFSTVFIDEAAQALEPACWIPVLKATRVIMAGDHQQLPPTLQSREGQGKGLSLTLFEKLMNREGVSTMLKVQYRMHRDIMGFSSKEFYEGKLIAAPPVARRCLVKGNESSPFQPFQWIDTAGTGFEEAVETEGSSKFNIQEAQFLVARLQALQEAYQQATGKELLTEKSVGIISPYSAQVKLIKSLLAETMGPEATKIEVASVDSFQGQERDVILISMVRSNPEGKVGFLQDFRRTNVSITRAKSKLLIIGDSATLAHLPFYDRLLQYAQQVGGYSSTFEWM